ncbi:MAG: hypothetical protein H7Y22_19580 [Gemmatimonadaceae bacterium]|nr:hypothetical protein [Gloeobacterales cyanobacterium ES-bin-141]
MSPGRVERNADSPFAQTAGSVCSRSSWGVGQVVVHARRESSLAVIAGGISGKGYKPQPRN